VCSISEPLLASELGAVMHPHGGLPYGGAALAAVKEAVSVHEVLLQGAQQGLVERVELGDGGAIEALCGMLAASGIAPSAVTGLRKVLGGLVDRTKAKEVLARAMLAQQGLEQTGYEVATQADLAPEPPLETVEAYAPSAVPAAERDDTRAEQQAAKGLQKALEAAAELQCDPAALAAAAALLTRAQTRLQIVARLHSAVLQADAASLALTRDHDADAPGAGGAGGAGRADAAADFSEDVLSPLQRLVRRARALQSAAPGGTVAGRKVRGTLTTLQHANAPWRATRAPTFATPSLRTARRRCGAARGRWHSCCACAPSVRRSWPRA
jgi:hypothetical protein